MLIDVLTAGVLDTGSQGSVGNSEGGGDNSELN